MITLTEFVPVRLPRTAFDETTAKILWQRFRSQVAVEFPSFMTNGEWQLTAQGWAGLLPLSPRVVLALQPKTPIANLFQMIAYAYDLADFQRSDLVVGVESTPVLFERLAHVLAQRILARGRRGLYQGYLSQTEQLPFVRGRIDQAAYAQRPPQSQLPCRYEESAVDIEDNQLLLYTIYSILRSGLSSEQTVPTVRQAFHLLQGSVTLHPMTADLCRHRVYHRLNQDYAPLHALCAFFLDHIGPSHLPGQTPALPFLVDMARLFERFVAEWLRREVDARWQVRVQEHYPLGTATNLHFAIDLVVYERASGAVRWVLDTKYKTPERSPSTADIAQIVAYAHAKGAHEAALIYPAPLPDPLDVQLGGVRVRSLTFDLRHDLNTTGRTFLQELALQSAR